jgi:archaellum component FlaD/FlaE
VATVAKQNPDLMKNISSAMAKAMAQNANADDDDEDETDDDAEEEDDEDDEVETVGAMGEQLVMQQLAQSIRPTPPLQRAKNARIQETAPPQKRHKTAYSTTSSERAVDVRI